MTKISNLRNFIVKYVKEFQLLIDQGNLTDSWENVADHCFIESLVADVCADLFLLDDNNKNDLVKAAILHDWYKRNEREAADKYGYQQYKLKEKESENKLLSFGYSKRICELTGSVGHLSLKDVENSDDLVKLLMHIIDSMTLNDKFVSLNERIDMLESVDRYRELNESGKAIWHGKTHFQAMRKIDSKILDNLCNMLKIETKEFVNLIASKIEEKFGLFVK